MPGQNLIDIVIYLRNYNDNSNHILFISVPEVVRLLGAGAGDDAAQ